MSVWISPSAWRGVLARAWWHARSLAGQARRDSDALGVPAALSLVAAELALRLRGPAPRRVSRPARVRGYRHPVYYRPGGSDRDVMTQVLGEREYACAGSEPGVRTILDLGGNVGVAAFYFLHRYPEARLLLVEPDAGNLAVARRTLAPFARRVKLVQAGVWQESADMVVERGNYRDGNEWAYRVRPCRAGEAPEFRAATVPELLETAGFRRVDLIKIDIESAEAQVFAPGARPGDWLGRVGTLVIETHGPECERVVTEACAPLRPAVSRVGLLTLFRFPRP